MANDWNDRRPNQNSSKDFSRGGRPGGRDQSRDDSGNQDRSYSDDRSGFDAYSETGREIGRGMTDPRDQQIGGGSANGFGGGLGGGFGGRGPNRRGDISDFSLGIDRSNQNDRSQGDWFQSPYQSSSQSSPQASSQFPSNYGRQNRGEGWGANSAGFPQNPNYSSYSAGLENGRDNYVGRGPKGYRRSDDRIKEDIGHALEQHPAIDASQLEVLVAEGVVTLKGHVENRAQKRMAEHSIEHLAGVKDVRNELVIDQSLFDRAREFLFGADDETADDRANDQASSQANGMKKGAKDLKAERDLKTKRDSRKRPM